MVRKNSLAEKQPPGEIQPGAKEEMLGLEGFDACDLVIPRYKIVQPTSKEGTPGLFRNNLTNEEVDKVNVVVLAASKGRVCWGASIEEDPVCRSSDGLLPSKDVEKPVNSVCGTKENGRRFEPVCPNAIWQDNYQRPACDEVINLLCISRVDRVPFFISLHGMQLKPVRAFLSAIGLRKKSLYEFQATLTLKETTNHKGKFFVVQFGEIRENAAAEKELLRARFFQFANQSIDKTFEAEKKMKDDEVPFA